MRLRAAFSSLEKAEPEGIGRNCPVVQRRPQGHWVLDFLPPHFGLRHRYRLGFLEVLVLHSWHQFQVFPNGVPGPPGLP